MKRKTYKYIKDLVFDIVRQTEGLVDYETVTKEVKKYFPDSKWQKTHWGWYKSRIRKGKYQDLFSKKIKENLGKEFENRGSRRKIRLKLGSADPKKRVDIVKHVGDELLNHVRFMISEISKDNADLRFKLNRWVYGRLMQDEIREKRPVKKELWESGMQSCQKCSKKFNTLKGVEIHRKDSSIGYSVENCELLCRPCHQKK